MGSNLIGDYQDHDHHSINIWDVNKNRLALMQQKISAAPEILSKSAGRSSCCIFRVPKSLHEINGQHYQPQIVSIGPYHHGEPQLAMIEEHKWRFLGALLKRTQHRGVGLEDYLRAVYQLESRARACYYENIRFSTDEFIEMLVLDGCFIIELFRKFGGVVGFELDDPLISISWVYSFLLRDLIRLENQIPFFILQCLYDLTLMPDEESSGPSIGRLTLKFFNNALQRSDAVLAKYSSLEGRHLLDFLRSSFIPPEQGEPKPGGLSNTHIIPCVSYLYSAGINLKPGEEDSFLAVKFRHGVIEMSSIALDDFMSSFLLNSVAYEQCQAGCSKHMTTYATFLDCLINSAKDAKFLSDWNIIENYFGTNAEIAKFINNMGKDVTFDIDTCYLARLFNEVNEYYRNSWHVYWHVQWTSFKDTYFKTPWSFISALAAFVLLVLTVLQTFYTIRGYYAGQK